MPLFSKSKKKEESKKEKEMLKALKDKRDLAIEFRENTGWDERAKRAWNYYKYGTAEDLDDATLLTRKKRYANYVFSNIESIIPKIFDRFPGFQVKPRGNEDIDNAPVAEELLRYKVDRTDLEQKYEYAVRDMLVPGFGLIKLTWGFQGSIEKKKEGDEEDYDVNIEYDDIRLEVLDPMNFYITAGDCRLDEAEGCFERMYVSPDIAKARYGKEIKADYTLTKDEDSNLKGEAKRCVIWQYTGRCKGKEGIWYFTDTEVLDFVEPYEHGQKPYVVLPNYRTSTEFYGLSEVFEIEPLQDELTEIDRQFSEFRKRAINPRKIVKSGAVDETNLARLKDPRINVVEANDPNGISWENPALIGQDLYNIRLNVKEDIGLITGQNELSRGGTERTIQTATGQQILFDAAQSRIRQKTRTLEAAVKKTLQQMQGLMAQYMDKEEMIQARDSGDNPFAEYTKEDIAGNFDYIIDIVESTPILREKRGQLAQQAYQAFKDDPDIDQRMLKQKVLKLTFGDINAEELVKEPDIEEMPEELPMQEPMQQPPVDMASLQGLMGNVPLQ